MTPTDFTSCCSAATLQALKGGCVATVGFFDGVHRGHRFLLKRLRETAAGQRLPSLVISFWPHPRKVLHQTALPLLTDNAEKQSLLKECGIDHVVILPFTPGFASLTAAGFMRDVLAGQFHVKSLLMGYDHRFGRPQPDMDSFEDYRRCGRTLGIDVIRAEALTRDTSSAEASPIGSSAIREALLAHRIDEANEALGYPYRISGRVVGGFENGHRIGFPTANILPDSADKLLPADGVYAVKVSIDHQGSFDGMLNIGHRPTLHNGDGRSIEVNIFDFADDIYDRHITVSVCRFLREEQEFRSTESLSAQLAKDREEALRLLKTV